MALPMAGRQVVLQWNATSLAGVREKNMTLNGDPIDVSSDDDNGWRKLMTISAEDQVNLDLSGVTKSQTLKSDWFAGNRTRAASLTYPSGGVLSGDFFMASYSEKQATKEAVTFEMSTQSSGTITWSPGSS